MFKQITKIVLFILIFVLAVSFVSVSVLSKSAGKNDWNNSSVIKGLYDEPKDSLDVLFIGSSRTAVSFSPMYLWKNYGFTSYTAGTRMQQPIISELLLKDTWERQHYKAVVMDVTQVFERNGYDTDKEYYSRNEPKLTESLLSIPFSLEKLKTVYELNKKSGIAWGDMLFSLYRFHGRWESDLSRKDFSSTEEIENKRFLHGQEYMTKTRSVSDTSGIIPDGAEKNGQRVQYDNNLIDIIEFCLEKDIKLILTRVPSQTKWSANESATMQEIADQYGITFVDYTREANWNAANMDLETDYFDSAHFNCRGAEKVSALFGEFLTETAELADKRNDPAYAQWNEDIDDYEQVIADSNLTKSYTVDDFFANLNTDGKLILISADGESYTSLMSDEIQVRLTELGLDGGKNGFLPEKALGYTACIDDGAVILDEVSKKNSTTKRVYTSKAHVTISAKTDEDSYPAFAIDNLVTMAYPENGIHILVYNTRLEKTVDSVTLYPGDDGKWVLSRKTA